MAAIHQRNLVDAFAVTAPGLEAICAAELAALGVRAKVDDGGVAWRGSLESVALANLWLRTASRVLVRVAEFKATAFYELEPAARRIAWDRFVTPASVVRFRVTCRKSKLYHSDAVAQRLADAVTRRVPGVRIEIAKSIVDDSEDTTPTTKTKTSAPVESTGQLFVVRLLHDVCTVSADASGALLHLRGYRRQLAKAPLRETIAAAMILGAGWTTDAPLIDPMCGSGTIAIEAARMARRIAPGRDRRFAFHDWPEFDAGAWRKLVDKALAAELPGVPAPISASDRDRGAIAAALANAERAGVAGDIAFVVAPISALESSGGLRLGRVESAVRCARRRTGSPAESVRADRERRPRQASRLDGRTAARGAASRGAGRPRSSRAFRDAERRDSGSVRGRPGAAGRISLTSLRT